MVNKLIVPRSRFASEAETADHRWLGSKSKSIPEQDALVAELQHLQLYFALNGKEGQIAAFVPQMSIT